MASDSVTILAVDDIPDNLFILESILGDVANYHFKSASGGKAALALVDEDPPDLILLDVMMPDMDGYEVVRRIRQKQDLPYIPILLVTAHDQPSLSEGLDTGADDFIRKPFNIDELMARVRSLLRCKKSIDEQAEMIRQRDDFVARLTHDLRTPLVAASRVLRLVLDGVFGEPPSEMTEAIENVITNNQNLLHMTNTLLQVYRHEAGQKKLACSRLSLYSLTQGIVQELRPLAEEKNLTLTFEPSPAEVEAGQIEQAYCTEADPIELRRLLTNLLGNAIKFTDQGGISVQLSRVSTDGTSLPTPQAIAIAVTDTGVGIDDESQKRIFEWFYQGNHMRAGSGLGLHLSKRIAEMHQGTLTLTSQLGKGSTFTLTLPKIEPSTRQSEPVESGLVGQAKGNRVEALAVTQGRE